MGFIQRYNMCKITFTEPNREITYDDLHRIVHIKFLDTGKSVGIDYAVGKDYTAIVEWSDGYIVSKKIDGTLEMINEKT